MAKHNTQIPLISLNSSATRDIPFRLYNKENNITPATNNGIMCILAQVRSKNRISDSTPNVPYVTHLHNEHSINSSPAYLYCTFNSIGDMFCISDQSNQLFVVHVTNNYYYHLTTTPATPTALLWNNITDEEIYVALSDCSLRVYSHSTGKNITCLGKKDKLCTQWLSLHPSGCYLLAGTSQFCTVWDIRSYSRVRSLGGGEGVGLRAAFYIPISSYILTCFRDDTIHIWDSITFEYRFQLQLPALLLENKQHAKIRTLSCSQDGQILCGAGRDGFIFLWSLETRQLIKMLETPHKSSIKMTSFISQPYDGGSSNLILCLTNSGTLHIIDILSTEVLYQLGNTETTSNSSIIRFTVNLLGKYCMCVMENGSSMLIDVSSILFKKKIRIEKLTAPDSKPKNKSIRTEQKPREINMWKVKEGLERKISSQASLSEEQNSLKVDRNKLMDIVQQFGEYPQKYRMFIWKQLLQLPENREGHLLLEKEPHEAWRDIHMRYPLKSRKLLRALEKCLTALSNWTPLFSEVTYLPELIFPFIKLYQNNTLLAFEVSASVLYNWCSNWFHYFPNPPINILSYVENLLAHHDSKLLEYLLNFGITSQVYAWPLMRTSLSEVFDKEEWLQIWDNLFSQPPGFYLYFITAFLICTRATLLRCSSKDGLDVFLRQKNTISANKILKAAYKMKQATPSQLCPIALLPSYSPLTTPTYPVFDNFPVFVIDYQKRERERIRDDELIYLQNRQASMELEQLRERRKVQLEAWASQQQQLIDAEENRKGLLKLEEDKLSDQRKRIQALNREMKIKELNVLEAVRERFLGHMLQQKDREVQGIEKEVKSRILARDDETKTALAELEIRQLDLEAKKLALEQQLAYDNQQALNELHYNTNVINENEGMKHEELIQRNLLQNDPIVDKLQQNDARLARQEVLIANHDLADVAMQTMNNNNNDNNNLMFNLNQKSRLNAKLQEEIFEHQNLLREQFNQNFNPQDILQTATVPHMHYNIQEQMPPDLEKFSLPDSIIEANSLSNSICSSIISRDDRRALELKENEILSKISKLRHKIVSDNKIS